MLFFSNSFFGPIPDNCSICGEPMAPADRITSLLHKILIFLVCLEYIIPIAFLFYRIILCIRVFFRMVKFDLFFIGLK